MKVYGTTAFCLFELLCVMDLRMDSSVGQIQTWITLWESWPLDGIILSTSVRAALDAVEVLSQRQWFLDG